MRKLFHFDSPRDPYHCDAVVLWCFDQRFELAKRKFLNRLGVARPDPIRIAGGPRALASPENDYERDFVLEQMRKSMRLHGTSRAILFLHSDCGAYGGLEGRFHNDREAEIRHYAQEFRTAAAVLVRTFPGLDVSCYYVDFEGVWDIVQDPAITVES